MRTSRLRTRVFLRNRLNIDISDVIIFSKRADKAFRRGVCYDLVTRTRDIRDLRVLLFGEIKQLKKARAF